MEKACRNLIVSISWWKRRENFYTATSEWIPQLLAITSYESSFSKYVRRYTSNDLELLLKDIWLERKWRIPSIYPSWITVIVCVWNVHITGPIFWRILDKLFVYYRRRTASFFSETAKLDVNTDILIFIQQIFDIKFINDTHLLYDIFC